jgi:hypothetical protein
MMKNYTTPELLMLTLEEEDILTMSTVALAENDGAFDAFDFSGLQF